MKAILGRKVGMTQVYDESGQVVPVTVVQATDCQVLQLRTVDRDGYEAVQLGVGDKPRRLARNSERGHVARLSSKRSKRLAAAGVQLQAKPNCEPKRFVREVRGAADGVELGQLISVAAFRPTLSELPGLILDAAKANGIDINKAGWKAEFEKKKLEKFRAVLASVTSVDVTGVSRGRGYSGVIRRHNYSGQRASHGVKKVHRHPGSTGSSADPSRTIKGRRMAGQYGNEQVTARNLKVVKVDEENHLLLLRGAVPGPRGSYVMIRQTNKVR